MEATKEEIYSVIGKPLDSKFRITLVIILFIIIFIIIIVFLILTDYIKITDPING